MDKQIKQAIDHQLGREPLFQENQKRKILERVKMKPATQHFRNKAWVTVPLTLLILLSGGGYLFSLLTTQNLLVQTLPPVEQAPEIPFVTPEEGDILVEWGQDNMDNGNHEYITIGKSPLVVDTNLSELNQGDVVYYTTPPLREHPSSMSIGRVVALPGNTIEIKGGKVYVNDEKLNTFYGEARSLGLTEVEYFERVSGENVNIESMKEYFATSMEKVTILPGQVFILSDMWWRGMDSKEFGAIDWDKLIGKVEGYADTIPPVDEDQLAFSESQNGSYLLYDVTLGDSKTNVFQSLGASYQEVSDVLDLGQEEVLGYDSLEIYLFDSTVIYMRWKVEQEVAQQIFAGMDWRKGVKYVSDKMFVFYSEQNEQALIFKNIDDGAQISLEHVGPDFIEENDLIEVME